jgi:hypothetical protein
MAVGAVEGVGAALGLAEAAVVAEGAAAEGVAAPGSLCVSMAAIEAAKIREGTRCSHHRLRRRDATCSSMGRQKPWLGETRVDGRRREAARVGAAAPRADLWTTSAKITLAFVKEA